MNKIILELNHRKSPHFNKLSFHALLVALSRSTSRDGIRIMPLHAGSNLDYLTKLQPDSNLKLWLSGFDQNGIWNSLRCSNSETTFKNRSSKKKARKRSNRCFNNDDDAVSHQAKKQRYDENITNINAANSRKRKFSEALFEDKEVNDKDNISRLFWYLEEEELSTVKNLFMQHIEAYYTDPELILWSNVKSASVSARDVVSLLDSNWLTGGIISAFLFCIYCQQAEPLKHVFFNTYFFSILRTPTGLQDVDHFTEHFSENYLDLDLIIPIHISNHWILMIVSKEKKTIFIIDSLRNRLKRDYLALLLKLML